MKSQMDFFDTFVMGEKKTGVHIILDAANFFFRSQFGYSWANEQDPDNPVAHVFGSISMLLAIYRKLPLGAKPSLYVAKEGFPKFRYDILPQYKGKRKEKNQSRPGNLGVHLEEKEFQVLFKKVWGEYFQVLQYLPSSWYHHPELEADDVIASLVWKIQEIHPEDKIWVVSSDQDLWSLVDDQVSCIRTNSEFVTPEVVEQKYGVGPEHIHLWKTIFGDSSDNIPKVPRVRKKVVTPLILKSDDLDDFFGLVEEDSFEGSQKEKEKILSFREQAYQNWRVTQLQEIPSLNTESQYEGNRHALCNYLLAKHCPSLVEESHILFT